MPKDLIEVKIFKKVLEGYFFRNTLYCSPAELTAVTSLCWQATSVLPSITVAIENIITRKLLVSTSNRQYADKRHVVTVAYWRLFFYSWKHCLDVGYYIYLQHCIIPVTIVTLLMLVRR